MRVAIVGAGSHVFGPAVLTQFLLEEKAGGINFVLIDPNDDAVNRLALVGRKMADLRGIRVSFTPRRHFDRAFEGADIVINLAAVEMKKRFLIDQSIVAGFDPGHILTEFGGLHGLSSSLRQMSLTSEIAREIRENSPNAWLVNLSNPLPRTCAAAYATGVKTLGLCSVSLVGTDLVAQVLGEPRESYPFSQARARIGIKKGGTNHLTWASEIWDKTTGQDLYPTIREKLPEDLLGTKTALTLERLGWLPLAGDDHIQDFLPLDGTERSLDHLSHGNDDDREFRIALMHEVIDGQEQVESLIEPRAWEPIAQVSLALAGQLDLPLEAVNLVNEGQIPELPKGIFVETSGVVTSGHLSPDEFHLPKEVLPDAQRTAEIHRLIALGFLTKAKRPLRQAIELDPTVTDKGVALRALDALLSAHADLIGSYD
ncbi:MAG: hypothetical protein MUC92_06085 [Fimbriimonadaceae bacterium]|jgi:alpha-galactosidase|nr:hypothetical protein [Fimbriimonadaceae bacterium]